MTRILGMLLGAGLLLALAPVARAQGSNFYPGHPSIPFNGAILINQAVAQGAQGAASYPPAAGEMYYNPPVYTAPGAVGSQYVETFPTYNGSYQPGVYAAQPVAPTTVQPAPAAPARPRGRQARRTRVYSSGYNQVPYATPLPQGRLYWPGSSMTPGYTPFSRYQTYGSGYAQSPYGSNFYGGYWKGWPRAFPMIGD